MASSSEAAEGLRQRNAPLHAATDDEARETVLELNEAEEKSPKDEENKKTFGRTPDGTVFTVPTTKDMVSQLFSPYEPKNYSDGLLIITLCFHVALAWMLPPSIRTSALAVVVLFWRAAYNVGIGYLLHMQSHHKTLVRWAKRSQLFTPTTKPCPYPALRTLLKGELEKKIPKDYDFNTVPIEYNTWLTFRRFVDLILLADFTSYMTFAIMSIHQPAGELVIITGLRWIIGIALYVFNYWVKVDAHRVVKDYAWYWGDFFFLIDQKLTFDGVYELAPHPMYSIGYAGYYGMCFISASYKVLFVSIIAHASQLAFLTWVENPHIRRIYNSPPPRRAINETPKAASNTQRGPFTRSDTAEMWPNPVGNQPSETHNLVGLENIDPHRITDISIFLLFGYTIVLTLCTPSTSLYQTLFVVHAVLWRVWLFAGIGYLLHRQSEKKRWTRHFLKYGDSTGEAWRQWKGTYHLSMTMSYASFGAAAWKMYTLPEDWSYGLVLLCHVVGFVLVALQIWVSSEIYDELGEFGWFYGDFFFDHSPKLTYGGIYRFLNNPERILGLAGLWGVALITSSRAIFGLALFWHISNFAFIQFVERPHMQKLYGRSLRQDSGVVNILRRSLPVPLRQWQESLDKFISDKLNLVDEFLDAARDKFERRTSSFFDDAVEMLQKAPARINIARGEHDRLGLNTNDYSLEIDGSVAENGESDPNSGPPSQPNALVIEYGAPIRVRWTAPANHGKLDWVGLYRVGDNSSRIFTHLSAMGRWVATTTGEFDAATADIGNVNDSTITTHKDANGTESSYSTGELLFSGDKLWWIQGLFEFRYHHNGKHNVMAISRPFEIRIPKFTDNDLESSAFTSHASSTYIHPSRPQNESLIRHEIEKILLPLIQNCFDRDPEIAPSTPQEAFGGAVELDGKYAKRVVYAVLQSFGIEFAPEVVKADGKVENLAWRIWEAKKVLAPYSMSRSRGVGTPEEEEGHGM